MSVRARVSVEPIALQERALAVGVEPVVDREVRQVEERVAHAGVLPVDDPEPLPVVDEVRGQQVVVAGDERRALAAGLDRPRELVGLLVRAGDGEPVLGGGRGVRLDDAERVEAAGDRPGPVEAPKERRRRSRGSASADLSLDVARDEQCRRRSGRPPGRCRAPPRGRRPRARARGRCRAGPCPCRRSGGRAPRRRPTTLKLWFVIPPPSGSKSTAFPGQSRSTASSTRMRDPRHVEALLFDFNGTLSDDEGVQCGIYRELFAGHGRPLSEDEYFAELAGYSDPEIVERWLGPGHPAAGEVLEGRTRLFRERVGDGSTVPAHVREALRSAVGRVRLAVVSGAGRSEVDAVLRAAEIDVFDADRLRRGRDAREARSRGLPPCAGGTRRASRGGGRDRGHAARGRGRQGGRRLLRRRARHRSPPSACTRPTRSLPGSTRHSSSDFLASRRRRTPSSR